MRRFPPRRPQQDGEFLWLVSLSDLMILLFILFVVLFSFSYKKMKQLDIDRMVATLANRKQPVNPIEDMNVKITEWIDQNKLTEQISIRKTEDSIFVEIKDKVIFPSGAFELHSQGITTVKSLAKLVERIPEPYRIGIEGHTDDDAIHTAKVQDNWDLSAKRALAVLYALDLSPKIMRRTVVMASGEQNPILPNRDAKGIPLPQNQAQNRRVTLRIF